MSGVCRHVAWEYDGPDGREIPCPDCGSPVRVSDALAEHRGRIEAEIVRLAIRDEAKREYADLSRDEAPTLNFVGAHADMSDSGGALTWLVEPILNVGSFVLLTAQAKTGKSTFVLSLLTALLKGEPFLGWPTHPNYTRRAAYLNFDMPPDLFRYYAEPVGAPDEILVLHGASGQYDVMDKAFTDELAAKLVAHDVGVMVVDVWSSIYAGDESDNSEAGRAIGALMQLRQAANLDSIILLHHAGWPGKEVKKNRSRGASAVEGKVDVLWRLDPAGTNRSTFYVDRSRIPYSRRTEVVYHEDTRTISVGGVGVAGSSESEAAEEARLAQEALKQKVLKAAREHPGLSQTALQDAVGGNAAKLRVAVRSLVESGQLTETIGERNAKNYCG